MRRHCRKSECYWVIGIGRERGVLMCAVGVRHSRREVRYCNLMSGSELAFCEQQTGMHGGEGICVRVLCEVGVSETCLYLYL